MSFNLKFSFIIILVVSILSSCSTSNDVAGDGLIQKRKYRKGLHLNFGKKHHEPEKILSQEVIAELDSDPGIANGPTEPMPTKSTINKVTSMQDVIKAKTKPFGPPIGIIGKEENDPDREKIESAPDGAEKVNTLTKSYQKKGKIALIFAWVFAIMPLVIRFFFLAGFIELTALAALIAFVSLLIALILGIANAKMSKHARRALLVVFLSMVFWGAAAAILNFLLGIAVI